MPSSKGKRNGKGSPQKTAAARRVHTRSTKSKMQARIEATQRDTLANISSPVGPKSNPKKLSPVSESTTSPKNQAPLPENSPERERGITATIVT